MVRLAGEELGGVILERCNSALTEASEWRRGDCASSKQRYCFGGAVRGEEENGVDQNIVYVSWVG